LDTIRKWLETDERYKLVDRIIFIVYLEKEKEIYEQLLPMYFPFVGKSKNFVTQQIQMLEWQLRQFEEYIAVDKTNINKKQRKKQKKEVCIVAHLLNLF
jgi:hypothetical protein